MNQKMPSHELTPKDRQRLAFGLLKQEAMAAHREGDGLRINLLCRTALDGIESLVAQKQLELSLTELRWVFVFQFYWLVDYFSGHLAVETFKKIPVGTADDEGFSELLECHQKSIHDPTSGIEPVIAKLTSISLDMLSNEEQPALEDDVLLTHLAELMWFRSAGTGEWEKLLDAWKGQKVRWIAELSRLLRRRLDWQTRMTVPSEKYPIVGEESLEQVAEESDLACLWLLHLHGRRGSVLERVRGLSPRVTPDSYRWRIVSDFWHIDRRFDSLDSSEHEGRWLARRRSLTGESPLLQFHERREMRIVELLGSLFRERVAANASKRRDVLQLAMLHELAALSLWDYGMWREATRAQSEVWLEASLWLSDAPGAAAHGLILGARGLALKLPKKDRLIRSAVERLEFAPSDLILGLANQLLASYPIQKYAASELIDEIADLFPSQTWPRLAEWTVRMAKEMAEKRLAGEKAGPLAFWRKIVPSLGPESPVWSILLSETLLMAEREYCWVDEQGAFIRSWIEYAPLRLAIEVAEKLVQAPFTQNIFSLSRAEILVSAENNRVEFGKRFTSKLPSPAASQEERILLADHLQSLDQSVNFAAREVFAGKLAQRISLMVPPEGATTGNLPHERLGLHLIKKWEAQHQPLLERLLAAIPDSRLSVENTCELLSALQWIIANGPKTFAEIARPKLLQWVMDPTALFKRSRNNEHPFSTYHNVGLDSDRIPEVLGWVVFQYIVIEGTVARDLVEATAENVLRHHWQEPIGVLCRCLVMLASQLPAENVREKMTQVRQLLELLCVQVEVNEDITADLADALGFVVELVGPASSELVDWSSDSGKAVWGELIQSLIAVLPVAAKAARTILRIKAARILFFLQERQEIPMELKTLFDSLGNDNRARVRFATR